MITKMDKKNENEDFESPVWTKFFDGTLYRRYIRYLQHHDLSQMLYNGHLSNNFRQDIEPPVLTNETSWYPPPKCPQDDEMPPPYQSRLPSTSSVSSEIERKRIRQRTRLCICLGVTFIALAAAISALVIHCFFIDVKDEVIESELIHISGNFSTNDTELILISNSTTFLNNSVSKEMFLPFKILDGPMPVVFEPITISNLKTTIGQDKAKVTCIIQTEQWDTAYLEGGKQVKLVLSRLHGMTTNGMEHRHSFDYGLHQDMSINMTRITLEVLIRNIECEDDNLYLCGYRHGEDNTVKSASLTVERSPESNIEIKTPIAFIEGQQAEVEATWKNGFPSSQGNISWFLSEDGDLTNGYHLTSGEMIWRTKTVPEDCTTYLNTILKITPTMEMNDTYLYAVPTDKNVSPIQHRILVIPGDYCDGVTGDSNKPNPYTCKTFVRCRPDKIDVYPCPKNTCFIEDISQCDKTV